MTYLIVMGGLGAVMCIGVMLFLSYVVPRDLREIETRKQLGLEPSTEPGERDAMWGGAFDEEDAPDDDLVEDEEPPDTRWEGSVFGPSAEDPDADDDGDDDPPT